MHKISDEEIIEIVDKIIARENSITKMASIYEIPRTNLSRIIENRLKDIDENRYQKYKEISLKNQTSGGKISNEPVKVYGNTQDIKNFYITYLLEKSKGTQDKDIMNKFSISKATFYRKKQAYKEYLEQGKIRYSKEEFFKLPDSEKENILILKAQKRDRDLNKKVRSESEYKETIDEVRKYFLTRFEKYSEQLKREYNNNLIYYMITSNIDMIRLSMDKNIKPTIDYIDLLTGEEIANIMLKSKPFIISFSKQRIKELIKIAKKHNNLLLYARSSDRSSPQLLNALLNYAHENEFDYGNVGQILKRVKEQGITNERLIKLYPYKKYDDCEIKKEESKEK